MKLRNTQVNKIADPLKITFDSNLKGDLVQLTSETIATRASWGGLVLLNQKILPNLVFKFKVIYQEAKLFAIGASII